jgi:hypothetical protein
MNHSMHRDWLFVALSVPLAATAAALLSFVDFAHMPRNELIGDDVAVTREGCLDWWCRVDDIVPATIAALLLLAAIATFAWGIRRR